jgi:hypothetical protein
MQRRQRHRAGNDSQGQFGRHSTLNAKNAERILEGDASASHGIHSLARGVEEDCYVVVPDFAMTLDDIRWEERFDRQQDGTRDIVCQCGPGEHVGLAHGHDIMAQRGRNSKAAILRRQHATQKDRIEYGGKSHDQKGGAAQQQGDCQHDKGDQ